MPTELGLLTSLSDMYASRRAPPFALNDGGCFTWGLWFCRGLQSNYLAGTMPTELGLLTAMAEMYASSSPHPCVSPYPD